MTKSTEISPAPRVQLPLRSCRNRDCMIRAATNRRKPDVLKCTNLLGVMCVLTITMAELTILALTQVTIGGFSTCFAISLSGPTNTLLANFLASSCSMSFSLSVQVSCATCSDEADDYGPEPSHLLRSGKSEFRPGAIAPAHRASPGRYGTSGRCVTAPGSRKRAGTQSWRCRPHSRSRASTRVADRQSSITS